MKIFIDWWIFYIVWLSSPGIGFKIFCTDLPVSVVCLDGKPVPFLQCLQFYFFIFFKWLISFTTISHKQIQMSPSLELE